MSNEFKVRDFKAATVSASGTPSSKLPARASLASVAIFSSSLCFVILFSCFSVQVFVDGFKGAAGVDCNFKSVSVFFWMKQQFLVLFN